MTARIPLVLNSGAFQELQSGDSFNLGSGASLTSPTIATSMTLSYGTANQLQFLNGSKQLVGDADLTFDGTTLTAAGFAGPLTGNVTGNVSGNAGTVTNGVYTTGNQTIGGTKTFSANPILNAGTANGVVYANGSKVLTTGSALTFDGSNLGLGVAPSAWGGSYKAFQISGGSVAATSAETVVAQNAYFDGAGWKYIANGYATNNTQYNGERRWYTAPSGTAGNAISFTQVMTLDASGNLLLNTTSAVAGSKLVVASGDANINGLTVGRGGGSVSTNTANGFQALYSNTTGYNNTANGFQALYSNTTGSYNTANGLNAMYSNTTGVNNTANGFQALYSNTTGYYNTANGYQALLNNTTGYYNTANGLQALFYNTTGVYNTANGYAALQYNTTGSGNTANGYAALFSNTTGNNNTANGLNAMYSNTTGSGNTAINPLNSAGSYAPVFNPTTENDRFCMGSTGVTNAYIQVAWTVVSDARDKTDFATVPHGLDFVTKLSPTAYRYKMSRDSVEGHGPVRYGFKAQDVLALEGDNPVIVDAEDADKLRFNDQSMLAVLVNAIKELNTEVQNLKAELAVMKGL